MTRQSGPDNDRSTEHTPLMNLKRSASNADKALDFVLSNGYKSDSALVHRSGSQGHLFFSSEGEEDSDDSSDTTPLGQGRRHFQPGHQFRKKELPLSRMGIRPFQHQTKILKGRKINKQKQKRATNIIPQDQTSRVAAYCTCENIRIFPLLKWLQKNPATRETQGQIWHHQMFLGCLHSSYLVPESILPENDLGETPEHQGTQGRKDVFYFTSGCIVFWGLQSQTEEQSYLMMLTKFSQNPVNKVESEDLTFSYGIERRIMNDHITLESTNPSEKLAIAFALASSSKLDVFEQQVEDTVQETKHIPEDLARTGSIDYSTVEISKLIGRLFIVRADVNLNSDMLDTPDFFWEFDEWEPLYEKMMRYLFVRRRVEVLNSRLDVLRELLDVLNEQLQTQQAHHLEWIVIWLIVAEVVVQVVWNICIKDILGYFPNSSGGE